MTIKLNSNYRNRETGHFVRPVSLDRSAGRINERVEARNLTTGQTESWSTRLFLADHDLQALKTLATAPLKLAGAWHGDANGRND